MQIGAKTNSHSNTLLQTTNDPTRHSKHLVVKPLIVFYNSLNEVVSFLPVLGNSDVINVFELSILLITLILIEFSSVAGTWSLPCPLWADMALLITAIFSFLLSSDGAELFVKNGWLKPTRRGLLLRTVIGGSVWRWLFGVGFLSPTWTWNLASSHHQWSPRSGPRFPTPGDRAKQRRFEDNVGWHFQRGGPVDFRSYLLSAFDGSTICWSRYLSEISLVQHYHTLWYYP